MPYPKHPDTIIIQNKFYPKGIKEIDIWNYYQRPYVKRSIITEIKGRPVIVVLIIDGTRIVRRYEITPNYSKLITGRTVSIHTTIKAIDNFFVVDIDAGKDVSFDEIKNATFEVAKYLLKKLGPLEIRFTGSGFHIIHQSKVKRSVEENKLYLKELLLKQFYGKYQIGDITPLNNSINLDLAPMKRYGGHICRYSLTESGLICLPISINKIKSFSKQKAILKY